MGFLPVTWQTRDIGFSGAAKARILLQQSPLSERQSVVAGDDEVVEHLHVHERQSLLEVTSEQLIRLARLRGARRMVMSEDHGGGIGSERRLYNFPQIDAGLRQGAAEWLLERDNPVLRVKPDADEHFVRTTAKCQSQIVAHRTRRSQRRAFSQFLIERPARELEGGGELRAFRRAQSFDTPQLSACAEHLGDSSEFA